MNPDPVFAAAALDELGRRVRSRRPRPGAAPDARRSRPRWVMELSAVTAVLVLVAGVAVGVAGLRPPIDAGGGLSGFTTPTSTPEVRSAPPASPTSAPSGTPTSTSTSAPTGTPAPPTEAPTADPPTTVAPPPSASPTTPPTTPPPSAAGGSLIGPAGAVQRPISEIRTWALSLGYGDVWAEQAVLDTTCMAEHGFLYDPEFARSDSPSGAGMTAAQSAAYQVALYGARTDAPYDWRTAGCHGRTVHETGQDGKH